MGAQKFGQSHSLDTPTLLFYKILMGFCSDGPGKSVLIPAKFEVAYVAFPVAEIIGVAKNRASAWLVHMPTPKFQKKSYRPSRLFLYVIM